MRRKTLGTPKLTLLQRIKLRLLGYVYIGHYKLSETWRDSLPFYAFKCPKHGIVVDYPHGYYDRLDCPYCDYRFYINPPPWL